MDTVGEKKRRRGEMGRQKDSEGETNDSMTEKKEEEEERRRKN